MADDLTADYWTYIMALLVRAFEIRNFLSENVQSFLIFVFFSGSQQSTRADGRACC